MRFRRALAIGIVVMCLAACSSFGSSPEGAPAPDASAEGGTPADAGPLGDAAAEAGPPSVCSKSVYADRFTTPPAAAGWEEVGGGTFTTVVSGSPARTAVVTTVDLTATGQEAYLQRYVPVSSPASVRLRYGYYAAGNTAGAASVGCRLMFDGATGTSELRLDHQKGKANVELVSSATSMVDAFPYASGANVTDATWYDVDLRVDIVGDTGNVSLAGFDTTALGAFTIPAGLQNLRLRCGSGLLDYGNSTLGVGISNLEVDVCP